MLIYAPQLLVNTQIKTPGKRGIELGLIAINKCYLVCREHIKDRKGSGVFVADINGVAGVAKNAEDLSKAKIDLNLDGENCKLTAVLE